MNRYLAHAAAASLMLVAGCAPTAAPPPPQPVAPSYPVVGGATMDPRVAAFQNLQKSGVHRIFVSALQGAGAAPALSSAGAYTVFAPTDMAFRQLPNGTIEALMHPRSRGELSGVVNYHIVPGIKTRSQIMADVQAGGGTAVYRTRQGMPLRALMQAGRIILVDANGRRSSVAQADVLQANGVFHVVDRVLLPPQN